MRCLTCLIVALWSLPSDAQEVRYQDPPGAFTYHGCSDPTEEAQDMVRSIVGKWNAVGVFDFRQINDAQPIQADAPSGTQALCNTIREEAPIQHDYNRQSFFDAGAYYLVVTHPHDPDPTDETLSMGLRTVGVHDRQGRFINAVSF